MIKKKSAQILFCLLFITALSVFTNAQNFSKEFPFAEGGKIEVKNLYGKVYFRTEEERENNLLLSTKSDGEVSETDLKIEASDGKIRIEVNPAQTDTRIDLVISTPARSKVSVETDKGEIRLLGDFAEAEAESNTGTIYADVPLEALEYEFIWIASRPRFISEVDLEEVKEKAAGKFVVKGKINQTEGSEIKPLVSVSNETDSDDLPENETKKERKKRLKGDLVKLKLTTVRGIILLNVAPNAVPTNLRERPLTEAAKAIVRSEDSMLVNAIRRASPKYFSEYAATLPPRRSTPTLENAQKQKYANSKGIKRVTVQVMDVNNRAISGLVKADFSLSERGEAREILSVEAAEAPFNLVLLLDVSGSIEHYVDFIRKAARNFINTTSPQDKVAIVIFNDDANTLSGLTKNRAKLSESLDTFDAGGGTAYYDALAYSLVNTLSPLKGERTAIVVLSDGDDNRSFLPFDSLLGSIEESGALIYPLYVPSGLIAASASVDPDQAVDPLRSRYVALTTKAQKEGETLAKVSGGVYYPISRLSELQEAYDDIVKQLRTAYTITYASDSTDASNDKTSPRLKVKVNRDTAFVKLGPVVNVSAGKVSEKD